MKPTRSQIKRSSMGLGILLAAGLLLEGVSAVQYVFARKGIEQQAREIAQIRLQNANLLVEAGMASVEIALSNAKRLVEEYIDNPEAVNRLSASVVDANPEIPEVGVLFVPNFYKGKRVYHPSTYRSPEGLVTEDHSKDGFNYYTRQWYTEAVETDAPVWTDPYISNTGTTVGTLICTYSVPVKDHSGQIAGVLFADVSMDWLQHLVEEGASAYPNSFSVILNKLGKPVVDTREGDIPDGFEDVRQKMIDRQTGDEKLIYSDTAGRAFYSPLGPNGWSMAIVCPEDEMFADFHRISLWLQALMLIGLLILTAIMAFFARGLRKMWESEDKARRMSDELDIAHSIQMGMIPKIFPPYPERDDIDIYASLTPAKEVGGDLFDFFVSDEKLWFCIGDVSGKGVPASLVMAVTRSQFRTVAMHGGTPAQVMSTINDGLSDMNDNNMFVTMIIARLDLATGEILFCNAGHNTPVLVHGNRKIWVKMKPNLPLGLMKGFEYVGEQGVLYPGDSAFLYTDGLTEAEDDRQRLFGEEAMIAALKEDVPPRAMIKAMEEAVASHINGAPQSDDLTMLAIQYKGGKEKMIMFPAELPQLEKIPEFVESLGVEPACTSALNLAIEEAATNVVNYAYEGAPGIVKIEALVLEDKVKVVITDSGKAFDPTERPDPDLTLPGMERPVGGLGVFLVKKLMDEVRYERRDSKNILILIKRR